MVQRLAYPEIPTSISRQSFEYIAFVGCSLPTVIKPTGI